MLKKAVPVPKPAEFVFLYNNALELMVAIAM